MSDPVYTATAPDGYVFTQGETVGGSPSTSHGARLRRPTHAVLAQRSYHDAMRRALDPDLAQRYFDRNRISAAAGDAQAKALLGGARTLEAFIAVRRNNVDTADLMGSYDRWRVHGWHDSLDSARAQQAELEIDSFYADAIVVEAVARK